MMCGGRDKVGRWRVPGRGEFEVGDDQQAGGAVTAGRRRLQKGVTMAMGSHIGRAGAGITCLVLG